MGEDRQQLILLGNSPSSGSTLLADLLDSAPFAACGPELELFCNRELYDFSRFQRNPKRTSNIATLKATGIHTRYDHLPGYGLSHTEFNNSFKEAPDLNAWIQDFARGFLAFRKKPKNGMVFEKTPQNANAIDLWLDTHPDHHFIYTVRHPLYVLDSLLRRGWGPYTASATWLVNVALYWNFREHPRVHLVKYEDLVGDPFPRVSALLNMLCSPHHITAEDLRKSYEENPYRKQVKRISTWSTGDDKSVQNANNRKVSNKAQDLFEGSLNTLIDPRFASVYGIPELSMREALDFFDYSAEKTEGEYVQASVSINDAKKLWMKSLRYLLRGESWRVSQAHHRAVIQKK
ncbi:sulfotransferase [Cryomorphaceae bacterium]|nr:sulfotransferase [Cryomorphaceae bacterium]